MEQRGLVGGVNRSRSAEDCQAVQAARSTPGDGRGGDGTQFLLIARKRTFYLRGSSNTLRAQLRDPRNTLRAIYVGT